MLADENKTVQVISSYGDMLFFFWCVNTFEHMATIGLPACLAVCTLLSLSLKLQNGSVDYKTSGGLRTVKITHVDVVA